MSAGDGYRERTLRGLIRAVIETLHSMALVDARPVAHERVRIDQRPGVWSWIRIQEPFPGQLVLLQSEGMGRLVAATMAGLDDTELGETELLDAQAELTNVIAGRLLKHCLGDGAHPYVGLPRTGRGAPDVHRGDWLGQVFCTGPDEQGEWLAAFFESDVLLGRHGTSSYAEAERHGLPGSSDRLLAIPAPVTAVGLEDFVAYQSGGFAIPAATQPGTAPLERKRADEAPGDALATQPALWRDAASGVTVPLEMGSYRIVRKLGEGGMAFVFLAEHLTLKRQVALKVLRPTYARDQRYVGRFLREARVAALVEHPNVVPIYDAERCGEHLTMAMRYIAGGSLAEYCERRGRLTPREAVGIVCGCLEGLSAIDRQGIIHRDLKPENILLSYEGVPLIADLGLARPGGTDGDGRRLTVDGALLGTPHFMSPEQVRGSDDLDIRTDIYALGATLYDILAGRPPFLGDSQAAIMAAVLHETPPDPRQCNPAIGASLAAVMMRALARDREQRYARPAQFLAALQEALADDDRALPPTPEHRVGSGSTWLRRLFGRS